MFPFGIKRRGLCRNLDIRFELRNDFVIPFFRNEIQYFGSVHKKFLEFVVFVFFVETKLWHQLSAIHASRRIQSAARPHEKRLVRRITGLLTPEIKGLA